MKGCKFDTDSDGNCHIHPQGCPSEIVIAELRAEVERLTTNRNYWLSKEAELKREADTLAVKLTAAERELTEAAELNNEMKSLFDLACDERDAMRELLRQVDPIVVAHMLAFEDNIEDALAEDASEDDMRNLQAEHAKTKSLQAEIRSALAPQGDSK
jgi:hypothetical protein